MPSPSSHPRILVADDQPDVQEALRLLLKDAGFAPETAASPAEVLHAVETRDFDVLLMDMNYTRDTTSGAEGLDLLERLRVLDPRLPIVVMTAWGSVENVVDAMRRGARDYIEKPWDDDRLVSLLRTQVELGRALRHGARLEAENRRLRRRERPVLVAESAAMGSVLALMERIAPSDANVLITGEHGTGKEVVAHWIHAHSDRARRSMVTVNTGGLSEGVFESEVFGHVRGAFTDAKADRAGCFELAHEGTLFLDEIGNLGIREQAKLLRIIENGELQRVGSSKVRTVDVRMLTATNVELHELVQQGGFREDLLYRLNTVEVRLPPLRDRQEDIPLLARHFFEHLNHRYRTPLHGFDNEAMAVLRDHSWPGNVRELAHVVERSILVATGSHIRSGDLGLGPASRRDPPLETLRLDEAERYLIQRAMERHQGNVTRAAEALGLSRSALYRRLQQPEP